jgi:hypothetical protein
LEKELRSFNYCAPPLRCYSMREPPVPAAQTDLMNGEMKPIVFVSGSGTVEWILDDRRNKVFGIDIEN